MYAGASHKTSNIISKLAPTAPPHHAPHAGLKYAEAAWDNVGCNHPGAPTYAKLAFNHPGVPTYAKLASNPPGAPTYAKMASNHPGAPMYAKLASNHPDAPTYAKLASNHPVQRANDALEIVQEISTILDTGLDKETLSILIGLLELGVNPEALAAVVKELRREAAAFKAANSNRA
eukprot:gene29133-32348_t